MITDNKDNHTTELMDTLPEYIFLEDNFSNYIAKARLVDNEYITPINSKFPIIDKYALTDNKSTVTAMVEAYTTKNCIYASWQWRQTCFK